MIRRRSSSPRPSGRNRAGPGHVHSLERAKTKLEAERVFCPNTGSYPPFGPDLRQNPAVFLSPEHRAKSEILADLGAANALYIRIWDEIKAAK